MTWIRTIPMSKADEKLRRAIDGQKGMYPKEYFDPVHPDESGGSTIVGSHTLIPDSDSVREIFSAQFSAQCVPTTRPLPRLLCRNPRVSA
jgi:hypothetical protein